MDGELLLPDLDLPFAWCDRCGGLTTLSDDGLATEHTTPCGAHCQLSPLAYTPGDRTPNCNGNCSRCRTIRTGCKGDHDHPCGKKGCGECGVHASNGRRAFCNNARAICRMAWSWGNVTCDGCLAHKPATDPTTEEATAP